MAGLLIGIASLISIVGWIWIIVIAFSSGEPVWGFLSICGLLALVYGFMADPFHQIADLRRRRARLTMIADAA